MAACIVFCNGGQFYNFLFAHISQDHFQGSCESRVAGLIVSRVVTENCLWIPHIASSAKWLMRRVEWLSYLKLHIIRCVKVAYPLRDNRDFVFDLSWRPVWGLLPQVVFLASGSSEHFLKLRNYAAGTWTHDDKNLIYSSSHVVHSMSTSAGCMLVVL